MTNNMSSKSAIRPIDRLLDSFGWSALIVLWGYVILTYNELPDTIPIHFNFKNEPDNYGSKMTLFVLPVVATVVFALFTVLLKMPQKLNYPVKITPENAQQQYRYSSALLRYMKMAIALSFLLMSYEISQAVKGVDPRLKYSLPVTLALLLVPLGVYVSVSVRGKK